ncbi:MAG: hypothetical protein E6240_01655 [Clostridium butyricum]|nr:hypothetical protein [Clostridium butyricum]
MSKIKKLIDKLMFKIANTIRLEKLNYAINKEKLEYEENLLRMKALEEENEKLRNN